MVVSRNIAGMAEKPLTSVSKDYLEAIFDLDQEKKFVRVKDIAKRMDVKMPTVSSKLKTLSVRGLVNYEKYEYEELTKGGSDVGKEMRRRHEILLKFLTEMLEIEFDTANAGACKMEHTLGADTLDSLTDFTAFIRYTSVQFNHLKNSANINQHLKILHQGGLTMAAVLPHGMFQ
jgi:DtxR family Mn-dependent transcriptional regulator